MQKNSHVVIIGAGFAGISAASYLAKAGINVTVVEKHDQPGGRARSFKAVGFTFDMGPSWYWMPDVFDQYFADFGTTVAEHYDLVRLDPSYQVVFGQDDAVELPADRKSLLALFEKIEAGSAVKLEKFLAEAEYKYRVGMAEFVQKPGHSIMEFADLRVAKAALKLHMLKDMGSYVDKLFTDTRLRQILKFPVLFLGATPEDTPALYSLMNYADLELGTWYPLGGMHQMVLAMERVAKSLGVSFKYEHPVTQIEIKDARATGVHTSHGYIAADVVIGGADYHHVEQHLLPAEHRQYTEAYWDKRTMAPSSLLYYIGLNKRLKGLDHHNLFFDTPFAEHAAEIYKNPQWPSDPLFYVCVPSLTDDSISPEGCENVFILIPTAPDLGNDTEELRDRYYNMVMDRLEKLTGQDVRNAVVYKRSFAEKEFKEDYNAYKGNAYGLANTLMQTAFLKPKMRSPKVKGLFYTGQLTTPGPGVPPSLISGQVVAGEVLKDLRVSPQQQTHESAATL